MVRDRNLTFLVQVPVPTLITDNKEFLVRKTFSLIVEDDGLTEKSIHIIMPIRTRCGTIPGWQKNLMKDKTIFSSVYLVTVIGIESRPPPIYSNNPV